MNTAPAPNYGPLPTNKSLGIVQGPDVDHSIDREDKRREIIVGCDQRPLICIDLREPHQIGGWESCDPAYDSTGWSRR